MPFLTTSYPKIEISLYQVPWLWFLKDSDQVTLHARSPDPHCPLLTQIDFLQQSDSMEKKLHVSKWFNLYKHKKNATVHNKKGGIHSKTQCPHASEI